MLLVPKVEKIRSLNLPGTPRATSVCRGIPLLYFIRKSGRENWDSKYERIKRNIWDILFLRAKAEGIFCAFITLSVKCCSPVLIVTRSQPLDPDV